MANANRPSGLSPVNTLNSGPYNGQARIYSMVPAYNTALAIGDPVASNGTADGNGVAGIQLATAGTGNAIRGVIVGLGTQESLMANPQNLDITYKPANAPGTWYAMVVDDPNVVFEVQEVTGGTQLTALDVGLNANLLLGANNGFTSGWQLDNVGKAVGATLQVRLLGLARRSDNAFGAAAKWLVKINNHEFAAGTVGL